MVNGWAIERKIVENLISINLLYDAVFIWRSVEIETGTDLTDSFSFDLWIRKREFLDISSQLVSSTTVCIRERTYDQYDQHRYCILFPLRLYTPI